MTTLTRVSAGALLTACGGGSVSSPTAAPKTDSKPTAAAAPAAQPAATKPAEAVKPAEATKPIDATKPTGEGVGLVKNKSGNFIEPKLESVTAAAATAIAAEDDAVDALYEHVYRELLTFMIEDPNTIQRATWLLWVSHNVERIADRVTNICERVVYMATGKMEEINISTY